MGGGVVHTPAVEHEQVGFGLKGGGGGFHDTIGEEGEEVRMERRIYHGCERETFEEGKSKAGQGINREVSFYWGREVWGLPIEWHNVEVKSSAEGAVGIGSAELEEGGK